MSTDTDKEIRQLLPESINLYYTIGTGISNHLIKEDITYTFELLDTSKGMEVTVTIRKTLHY